MANRDAPHGLQLVDMPDGGSARVEMFKKLASYTTTGIFRGDVVHCKAGDSAFKRPPIEPWASATPGTTNPSGVSLTYGAGSTLTSHQVIVSPTAYFEAQDNNDTDGVANADIGLNGNVEAGTGVILGGGWSGHELDESTYNTSSARDVHLIEVLDVPDNALGAWCRVVVRFNHHRLGYTVAGV